MFVAVAIVVGAGLWLLVRQSSHRHGSAPLVLTGLPLALLFLITPVPFTAVQSARAFQATAKISDAGVKEAATLALLVARPLWFGAVGFVVAISIAAALQMSIRRRWAHDSAPVATPATRATWFVLASAVLIAPVGILTYLTERIATLVMEAGVALAPTSGVRAAVTRAEVARFSDVISHSILLAGFAGFPLLVLVFAFALGNVIAARYANTSDTIERVSWALFTVVAVGAVANVIILTIAVQSFGRAVQ